MASETELAAKFAMDAARAWREVVKLQANVAECNEAFKAARERLPEYAALEKAKVALAEAAGYHADFMAEQTPRLPGME